MAAPVDLLAKARTVFGHGDAIDGTLPSAGTVEVAHNFLCNKATRAQLSELIGHFLRHLLCKDAPLPDANLMDAVDDDLEAKNKDASIVSEDEDAEAHVACTEREKHEAAPSTSATSTGGDEFAVVVRKGKAKTKTSKGKVCRSSYKGISCP